MRCDGLTGGPCGGKQYSGEDDSAHRMEVKTIGAAPGGNKNQATEGPDDRLHSDETEPRNNTEVNGEPPRDDPVIRKADEETETESGAN